MCMICWKWLIIHILVQHADRYLLDGFDEQNHRVLWISLMESTGWDRLISITLPGASPSCNFFCSKVARGRSAIIWWVPMVQLTMWVLLRAYSTSLTRSSSQTSQHNLITESHPTHAILHVKCKEHQRLHAKDMVLCWKNLDPSWPVPLCPC